MVDLLQKNISPKITRLPPDVADGAGSFGGTSTLSNRDVEEVAKIMNLPFKEALNLVMISEQVSLVSLEKEIPFSDSTAPLYDVLPNSLLGERQDNWEPDYAAEMKIEKERLLAVLEKVLMPKEQKVLSLRYGLMDETERTLEEVGKEFGITRERVRQIQNGALKKLKAALGR